MNFFKVSLVGAQEPQKLWFNQVRLHLTLVVEFDIPPGFTGMTGERVKDHQDSF